MIITAMLIIIILGYMFLFRWLVTVLHFWQGVRFYRHIRVAWSCFRKYDLSLRAKFPLYNYGEYLKQDQSNEETKGDNEVREALLGAGRSEEICPICCEMFLRETEVAVMPCNSKHVYHPVCIKEWLVKQTQCPLCKVDVFGQRGASINNDL